MQTLSLRFKSFSWRCVLLRRIRMQCMLLQVFIKEYEWKLRKFKWFEKQNPYTNLHTNPIYIPSCRVFVNASSVLAETLRASFELDEKKRKTNNIKKNHRIIRRAREPRRECKRISYILNVGVAMEMRKWDSNGKPAAVLREIIIVCLLPRTEMIDGGSVYASEKVPWFSISRNIFWLGWYSFSHSLGHTIKRHDAFNMPRTNEPTI